MGRSNEYLPLAAGEDEFPLVKERSSSKRVRILVTICALQSLGLLICFIALIKTWYGKGEPFLLYSPAQEALDYEIKSFTVGEPLFGGYTKWQGAGPEVDAAWQELYNNTVLRIPKSQAAQLPNRTYPIAGDDGYYIAALDVFHQLHCLNMIRMALHKEKYTEYGYELEYDHVAHCVDGIRQSLMCSADISVNVWQWNEEGNTITGHSSQAHQCRSFEKLRDWAQTHSLKKMIDLNLNLPEDDLKWPHGNY